VKEPEQLDLLDWLAAQPPCPSGAMPKPEPPLSTPDPAPLHLTRVNSTCNMRRI